MKTQKLQNKIDNLIDKTFLWAFPQSFEPNWLSYARIATVPFIYYFLVQGNYYSALLLFVLSASTDFLDGTMARKRDKVTELGKVLDPVADKMLIATILLFIGFDYLVIKVFLIVIAFEIVAVLLGSILAYKIGRPLGANIFGKIKMILQSASVAAFLIGIILKNELIILASEYTLGLALVFAIISGAKAFNQKVPALKRAFKNLLHEV